MKWRRIPAIKKLLLGTALAGLTFASALAADMPAYPMPPPPPPPGIPDCWTGFYVGSNLGYHFGQDSTSVTADPFGWGVLGADAINSQTATWLSPRGSIVGAQMGFNWQIANVVFGWEGDGEWLGGASSRQSTSVSQGLPTSFFMYNSSAENAMATLRARLGWAFGTVMAYGTGGGAMGWFRNADSFVAFDGTTAASVPSTTARAGWTGGGGIEWKFLPAWSVKAEYLYFHMQNYNTTIPGCVSCIPFVPPSPNPSIHTDISVHHNYTDNFIRVGVNWHVTPW
jgi:outer membrane immunogenic protein